MIKRVLPFILGVAAALAASGPVQAQVQVFTDEASFLAAVAALGHPTFSEGFEGSAWDGVRTTIAGGVSSSPSVTSQGITWSSSTEVTTNNLGPRSGTWRGYDQPGGAPDTLDGLSTATLYAIGGWFVTNTPPTNLRISVGGAFVDGAVIPLTTSYQFLGVVDSAGFTTFQVYCSEGTPLDPKNWFADDFTFSTSATPVNHPPDGTIVSPAGDPTILAGQSVSFSGSVFDPDGDAVTVLWSFGDATSSTALSPGAHTYATPGSYPVSFTATDVHDLADPSPATRTVTVVAPGGVTVSPTSGLVTSESGASASFTVVLTSQPTATVTIGLSSSDTTEGTVSPTFLSFDSTTWSTPRTVSVTGVDDTVVDGDIAYSVVTAAAVSTDPAYAGLDPANVAVTNTDNDTAGITVSPASGLVTSESGASASFTVVLTSQPTATVTVGLSSSDSTEGTVSPTSVVFDSTSWSTPRTVTVTGVDDAAVDGDIAYAVLTAPAVSADATYSGLNPADVVVTNTDNDTAGITVSPFFGLVTSESGASASFTIVLATQPTTTVTVGLSSSDTSEGTVSPASVAFDSTSWSTPRTVTVTGVDDAAADGDVAYSVVTAPATSADPTYSGMNPVDVAVTNTDNDTAGISVSPTSGLVTSEAGASASFTIVLATQPTTTVTVGLSSSDTSEGTVSPASVAFDSTSWSTPKTVTVTGVDDAAADGDVAYSIVTAAATSADATYSGMNPADVAVTNTDNDTAGISVSPTSGLVTSEAGASASFTVVLTSQPTAAVTVGLSSSDTSEGTVSPASVAFDSTSWSTPRTVTVTGVDDAAADGDIAYSVVTAPATSADATYSGMNPADVAVTNTDNDTAGISVSPTSGLVTSEAGASASFTVVLTTPPTATVTVGLSSSDTSEGTVSPASVAFDSTSWSTPKTVTVIGVDDAAVDGDVAYSIVTAPATSADPAYSGMNPADVAVTNTDNDTAGISVSPTSGLVTSEAGASASFTVVLTSQPTAAVTVGLSSSDSTEGTVSPASVAFDSTSWSTPRTVTVTGVDDAAADGDVAYSVVTAPATSADPAYSGMNPADVAVTNADNDTAGITVSPTSGLVTSEAGASASFTVVLATQPTAAVTVGLSSSDSTEGTVSPTSLMFDSTTWSTPRTVTVTGVDDTIVDGDVAYSIVTAPAASADPAYSGMNPADVAVTNADDDSAGITVSPTSGLVTSESGASASFTVVLATQPTATVTVGLSSSDSTEGTVSPASVAFDSTSWSTPRTVTVTGVDDAAADGDVAYSVVTAPATSADPTYSGMNPADVAVTNTDNDSAGISVSPTSGLVTSESGASASFTVVLATRPTATVTVGLSSSDTSEGTVAPTSLTFDASTWSTPRTVTATGVDDTIVDGDVVYSIVTAPATSADPAYSGMDPVDVAVTNTDDDSAVITGSLSGVAATKGLQGSDWHTNLWIHNAGPTPARVEVHYVAKGSAPSFDAPLIVDLAAGQTAAFDDVLPLAFSRTSTSGSFLYRVVTGDARAVILRADTYNRLSSAERFGQNVPAVPAAAAAATGEVLYLPGPPDIDQYRFNVGLQSAGARHALVHVVDKASGSFLHTSTVTLDELGWVQLVDLQTSFALGRASGWYVEATGLDGPLVISGNLVDQRSNDSINIIGRTAKTDGGEVWLPGAALVAGFLGSDWHSDLFSINTSPLPTAATVSFFPRGPAHPDDVGCTAMPLELAGYEHRSSTDVLGGALGLPDGSAGALAVKQDRLHPILHTLRTYNDTVDGEGRRLTYGSATPAIPLEDFIGGGGEGRIVGITNDADTRSNLAIVNTHASASGERLPTTVDIELLDADGRAVIQDALVVKPHQNVQINKFVEHYLGPNADIADATLVVRVSGFAPGDTGGVAPIVYVVNGNRIPGVGTSDPQAVLAVRVPPTR